MAVAGGRTIWGTASDSDASDRFGSSSSDDSDLESSSGSDTGASSPQLRPAKSSHGTEAHRPPAALNLSVSTKERTPAPPARPSAHGDLSVGSARSILNPASPVRPLAVPTEGRGPIQVQVQPQPGKPASAKSPPPRGPITPRSLGRGPGVRSSQIEKLKRNLIKQRRMRNQQDMIFNSKIVPPKKVEAVLSPAAPSVSQRGRVRAPPKKLEASPVREKAKSPGAGTGAPKSTGKKRGPVPKAKEPPKSALPPPPKYEDMRGFAPPPEVTPSSGPEVRGKRELRMVDPAKAESADEEMEESMIPSFFDDVFVGGSDTLRIMTDFAFYDQNGKMVSIDILDLPAEKRSKITGFGTLLEPVPLHQRTSVPPPRTPIQPVVEPETPRQKRNRKSKDDSDGEEAKPKGPVAKNAGKGGSNAKTKGTPGRKRARTVPADSQSPSEASPPQKRKPGPARTTAVAAAKPVGGKPAAMARMLLEKQGKSQKTRKSDKDSSEEGSGSTDSSSATESEEEAPAGKQNAVASVAQEGGSASEAAEDSSSESSSGGSGSESDDSSSSDEEDGEDSPSDDEDSGDIPQVDGAGDVVAAHAASAENAAASTPSTSQRRLRVHLPEVEDWCIDYAYGDPTLWVITGKAWYKIGGPLSGVEPHWSYIREFHPARMKFEASIYVASVLQDFLPMNRALSYKATLVEAIARSMKNGYFVVTKDYLIKNHKFITEQISGLDGDDPKKLYSKSKFIATLQKQGEKYDAKLAQLKKKEENQLARLRKKEKAQEDKEQKLTERKRKREEKQEAKRRALQEEEMKRREEEERRREEEEEAKRYPIDDSELWTNVQRRGGQCRSRPPSSMPFSVPPKLLGEVLMCWHTVNTFRSHLKLCFIPLEDLCDALQHSSGGVPHLMADVMVALLAEVVKERDEDDADKIQALRKKDESEDPIEAALGIANSSGVSSKAEQGAGALLGRWLRSDCAIERQSLLNSLSWQEILREEMAEAHKLKVSLGVQSQLQRCEKVLQQLINHPNSVPFHYPVDVEGLGLTDYLEKIEHPMDLHTIKRRLLTGWYEMENAEHDSPQSLKSARSDTAMLEESKMLSDRVSTNSGKPFDDTSFVKREKKESEPLSALVNAASTSFESSPSSNDTQNVQIDIEFGAVGKEAQGMHGASDNGPATKPKKLKTEPVEGGETKIDPATGETTMGTEGVSAKIEQHKEHELETERGEDEKLQKQEEEDTKSPGEGRRGGGHEAFAKDVRLVWWNCIKYNGAESPLGLTAAEFSSLFERLYKKIVLKEYRRDLLEASGAKGSVKAGGSSDLAVENSAVVSEENGSEEQEEEEEDEEDEDEDEDESASAEMRRVVALCGQKPFVQWEPADKVFAMSWLCTEFMNLRSVRNVLDANVDKAAELKQNYRKLVRDETAQRKAKSKEMRDAIEQAEDKEQAMALVEAEEEEEEAKVKKLLAEKEEELQNALQELVIRTEPLGMDRFYCKYWFFPDEKQPRVFLEESAANTDTSGQVSLFAGGPELERLIEWLDERGIRERRLKQSIQEQLEEYLESHNAQKGGEGNEVGGERQDAQIVIDTNESTPKQSPGQGGASSGNSTASPDVGMKDAERKENGGSEGSKLPADLPDKTVDEQSTSHADIASVTHTNPVHQVSVARKLDESVTGGQSTVQEPAGDTGSPDSVDPARPRTLQGVSMLDEPSPSKASRDGEEPSSSQDRASGQGRGVKSPALASCPPSGSVPPSLGPKDATKAAKPGYLRYTRGEVDSSASGAEYDQLRARGDSGGNIRVSQSDGGRRVALTVKGMEGGLTTPLQALRDLLLKLEELFNYPQVIGPDWELSGSRQRWRESVRAVSLQATEAASCVQKLSALALKWELVLLGKSRGPTSQHELSRTKPKEQAMRVHLIRPSWVPRRWVWRWLMRQTPLASQLTALLIIWKQLAVDESVIRDLRGHMDRNEWIRLVVKQNRSFVPDVGQSIVYFGEGHAEAMAQDGAARKGVIYEERVVDGVHACVVREVTYHPGKDDPYAAVTLALQAFPADAMPEENSVSICRPPSPRRLLNQLFLEVLKQLQRANEAYPFSEPVSKVAFPDYASIVSHPMDLMTMRNKAENDDYGSLAQFEADLELIVSNCHAFCDARFPDLPPLAEGLLGIAKKEIAAVRARLAPIEAALSNNAMYVGSGLVEAEPEDHTISQTGAADGEAKAEAAMLTPGRVSSGTFTIVLRLENKLPEFIVPLEKYKEAIATSWNVGDRFRMLFRDASGARSSYYFGAISGGKRFDKNRRIPWEVLAVKWDDGDDSKSNHFVNPWEVERDAEPDKLRGVKRRREHR